MTKACLYTRYSPRPNPQECDSCVKQLERCRAYALSHGYEIVGEFTDEDRSGGRVDNRPGLQDALDKACSTQAVLVAYSLDRLARNTRDAIDILEKLRKNKADLASITESLNTRSAIGQFLFELLASFAQLQRRQIVERTSSAMRHYQKNGRRMGRLDRCPYGKMPDPNGPKFKDKETGLLTDRPAAMIDNPKEQEVIERIRQLRSQGNGLRKICQHLEEAGIPCRGKRWHPSTVASILRRTEQPQVSHRTL